MGNFIFEDTTFDIVTLPNSARGVAPIQVRAEAGNPEGLTFYNYHVTKGNSFLQVTSSDPETYRTNNVTLEGSVTGGDLYYGVNLNGADNVTGNYSCDRSIRLLFVKQIKACSLKGYSETGMPSLGNVNISNDSQYTTAFTEGSDFDMSFGEVAGGAGAGRTT